MVRRSRWLVVAGALVLVACVPAGAHAEFRVSVSVENEPVVFPDGMVAVQKYMRPAAAMTAAHDPARRRHGS